ncbi:unnamed protein product [Protopolystoma xenopodis]|uniref:Uncharacterized protein n=1 Tax=Protopolystoma xenopodis TaxID=117903 RepID=A0A3S5ADB8_9PLAT|nr:unnamed protein product [Protopolystoma xenopodis]
MPKRGIDCKRCELARCFRLYAPNNPTALLNPSGSGVGSLFSGSNLKGQSSSSRGGVDLRQGTHSPRGLGCRGDWTMLSSDKLTGPTVTSCTSSAVQSDNEALDETSIVIASHEGVATCAGSSGSGLPASGVSIAPSAGLGGPKPTNTALVEPVSRDAMAVVAIFSHLERFVIPLGWGAKRSRDGRTTTRLRGCPGDKGRALLLMLTALSYR